MRGTADAGLRNLECDALVAISYSVSDTFFTNRDLTQTRCFAIYREDLDARTVKGRERTTVKRFPYRLIEEREKARKAALEWLGRETE